MASIDTAYIMGVASEVISAAILSILVVSPYTASTEAKLGYGLLLVSHLFRLASVAMLSPLLFIVAELIRPLGLIVIGLAMVRAQ